MQIAPLPPDEPQRLASLQDLVILDTPTEERFDRITRVTSYLFDVPIALISLVDSNRQWFKSCLGISVRETRRDISFCSHAILSDDVFYIPDAREDSRFADNPLVTGEPFVRFYAGAPLSGPDGRKVGTLCIIDHRPRKMSSGQLNLLKDLANWAHLELTAVQVLRKEIARKIEQLQATEQTFFKFMEGLPVGVFVIDAAGTPYYANQTAQQLLGKGIIPGSTKDQLAETYRVYVEGTDTEYPVDRLPIVRALEGRSTQVDNIEIHRPDGIMSVQSWATPIFDNHGNITHAISAFQDVTEHKRAEKRIAAQYAVSLVLAESTTVDDATPKILRVICENLGWVVGAIWRIDSADNVLRCADVWHEPSTNISDFESLTRKFCFQAGVGLPGRVWSQGEPVWISNIVEDPNFPRTPAALRNQLRSAFAFPIVFQNEVIGVMEFFSKHVQEPDRQLLTVLKTLGAQIGQFLGQKRMEDALQISEERYRRAAGSESA